MVGEVVDMVVEVGEVVDTVVEDGEEVDVAEVDTLTQQKNQ
jgi:hypothetical protein